MDIQGMPEGGVDRLPNITQEATLLINPAGDIINPIQEFAKNIKIMPIVLRRKEIER